MVVGDAAVGGGGGVFHVADEADAGGDAVCDDEYLAGVFPGGQAGVYELLVPDYVRVAAGRGGGERGEGRRMISDC